MKFIGNNKIPGILKPKLKPPPKSKTPPVSPKKVTFDVSSQESNKSSVESTSANQDTVTKNLVSL